MKKYIISVLCVLLFFFLTSEVLAFGVITDIHAGKGRVRKALSPKVNDYPSKAVKKFQKALREIKASGESIVFILGDSTRRANNFYARKLKKIADKSGLKIFWTLGNHDAENSILNLKKYYFEDIGDRRVVVLDTNEIANIIGGVSENQLNWLKTVLDTDKKVIILQHHPVFYFNTDQVHPQMEELKKIEDSAENVEQVLSGHWHLSTKKDIGKFKIFPPISAGRGYLIVN